jgi:hypothetical protein
LKNRAHAAWLILALLTPNPLTAGELDDLLRPVESHIVEEDLAATAHWQQVVDAFRASDFGEASKRGGEFLKAPYKATPYQVLGVQVMISLADGETGIRTSMDKEAAHAIKNLDEERADILHQAKVEKDAIRESNALIDRLTANRTIGVQQGSHNHRQCIMAQRRIEAAERKLAALEAEFKALEAKLAGARTDTTAKIKDDMLRLLQMLKEANEIPAAYAICNVYLRKQASDLDVAKFQQDFSRLQKIHERAQKVVALIRVKQEPHVSAREYWSARRVKEGLLADVDSQASDAELPAIVRKLAGGDPLLVEAKISQGETEAKAIITLVEVDAAAAQTRLLTFKALYPDYPETPGLEAKVTGQQSTTRQKAVQDLVAEIEAMAETSPEAAMALLKQIDTQSLSEVDRLRLEVRVTAVASRVHAGLLASMELQIEAAAKMMGGEVYERLHNFKGRYFANALVSGTDEAAQLRERMDKAAEKPKVVALLKRVETSANALKEVPLSSAQKIQLDGILAQVGVLREACL